MTSEDLKDRCTLAACRGREVIAITQNRFGHKPFNLLQFLWILRLFAEQKEAGAAKR
jgi:hypothetical protein